MLLECEQLTKRFNKITALNNLNVAIPETSRSIGLIGANGAGKTTLFSLVSEHIKPSQGSIKVLGKNASDPSLKGLIGVLPQDADLFKNISIQKQFIHLARLHGLSKTAALTETQRVLGLVNMLDAAKKAPESLSHGQRKRVMIAQALIGTPKLILLDEPTAGLDPVAANDIRELIATLKQEHCFIISSHNLHEIEGLCDSVLILKQGELITFEKIDTLLHGDQTLTITLNQAISKDFEEKVNLIDGVISTKLDIQNPAKFNLEAADSDLESVQEKLMVLITESGLSMLELQRGSNLNQEVINLIKS